MKKLLLLSLTILLFSCGDNNEDNEVPDNIDLGIPIPNAQFKEAVNACLETNPIDGLCTSNEYGAMPNWNVSQVTDMEEAFRFKTEFNGDISSWNVSNVSSFGSMFYDATVFNQDLSSWNVSNASNCRYFDSLTPDWNKPKPNFSINCD